MGTKKSLVILLIILSSIKCSKENENVLSGTYVGGTIADAGPIYMYTRNGQITDTGFIRQYLINLGRSDTFFSFKREPISFPWGSSLKLEFEGNNIFRTDIVNNRVPCRIESQSSSSIIISFKDSSEYTFHAPINPIPNSRCDTLNEYLRLPKITKKFYPLYGATGITGGTIKWLFKFPIQRENTLLKYPLMTYSSRSFKPTGYICHHTIREYQYSSTYDPSILGKLEQGDTVVYQLTYLPLIKQ